MKRITGKTVEKLSNVNPNLKMAVKKDFRRCLNPENHLEQKAELNLQEVDGREGEVERGVAASAAAPAAVAAVAIATAVIVVIRIRLQARRGMSRETKEKRWTMKVEWK